MNILPSFVRSYKTFFDRGFPSSEVEAVIVTPIRVRGINRGRVRTHDHHPGLRKHTMPKKAPSQIQRNPIERPMPHNIEAERSVLGAILLDNNGTENKALDVTHSIVTQHDFFGEGHREIFSAMVELSAGLTPIDLVTVTERLRRGGELKDIPGGEGTISKLIDGVPHVTNVEYYARIVKEKSLLRGLIHATNAIQQQALDAEEDADAILDRASDGIAALRSNSPATWKQRFHTVEELPEGEPVMPIEGILPEGVTFLGANSGQGKTWFALAMSRALNAGRKFLGVWDVPAPCNVLYLCPEMNARSFKRRCKRFGIGGERFRCMTIADGIALNLNDPLLRSAIRELSPVVFLDTAIRFSSAESENSSSDNAKGLAPAIFSLIHAGARAVVCLHHRAKGASLSEDLTLENCLRGTTDLGAICDAVYGLQLDRGDGSGGYLRESKKNLRLFVRCVKLRDGHEPADFRVALDPYLDELHDMAVVTEEPSWIPDSEKVAQVIAANQNATLRKIAELSGIHKDRIKKLASERGWHQNKTGGWKKAAKASGAAV